MQHTLATKFFERTVVDAEAPAVQFKEGKGAYQAMNWRDYGVMVKQLAFGLAYLGLEPKSCVAIFAPNSQLWVAADLATISNGGISVPIYPTSSQSDMEYILSNSETKIIFIYNEPMLKKVLAMRSQLPALKRVVLMRPLGSKTMTELMTENGLERERTEGLIVHFSEVLKAGANMQLEKPELIDERINQAQAEDVATIIYTSGTTGVPKGAEITHSNIEAIVTDIQKVIPITKNELYLSYLPLSHVFERVCGEVYWIHYGGICAFAESIETMAKNLGETEPTMLLVVPRVLDRIYAKVKSGIDGASGRRRDLIQWALGVGKEYVRTLADGKEPRPALRLKHWLSDKLVFQKMRQKIAPRLRLIVSGGAPATPSVLEFFNAIGVTTLEGWGLTETCAPASVHLQGRVKIGTVGPALSSVQVKLEDDGEILLKGPTVVKGYYKNPQATADSFVDGWFKTGDIGTIDSDGYIKITDRKKDIIVNSAGKNIAPQKVEAVLKNVPYVTQAVVFGDKQKALVALLTLDETAVVNHGHENNWEFQNYNDLIMSSQLSQFLRKEIQLRSGKLADYEQVKNFAILPEELSVNAGELTATLKVKRNVIAQRYRALVEGLYKRANGAAAEEIENTSSRRTRK